MTFCQAVSQNAVLGGISGQLLASRKCITYKSYEFELLVYNKGLLHFYDYQVVFK